jgi:hypothetical protein
MSFRLQWPVKNSFITQQFGERPEFYKPFGLPGHEGIDFNAPEGAEIYAAADGVVSQVRLDGDSDPVRKPYGNQVRIQHDGGYLTTYAHLSQVIARQGQTVGAGQLIGLSGHTGNSQGAHLYLTLKKQGATQAGQTNFPYDIIDPNPYLAPFAESQPEQPAPPAPTMQVQVASPDVGYLNMRSVPSVSGALVTQVPDKAMLDVLEAADVARGKIGKQGQWLRVRTSDGKEGYVAAWYLRLPNSAPPPALAPVISVVVNSPDAPLKVRSGPGVQNVILAQVPDGTTLKALESADAVKAKVGQPGQWLQVQTPDGVTGYSAAWYLRMA